jgi:hypothetical protein
MFSNGKWCINVKTVGEAIRELSLLDPTLPMDQDYDGNGADIVVLNRDQSDRHVQFSGGGFWDEDEDE